ncbi:uncharacterized protein ACIB01_000384 [Guaruba guarouba]
MQTTFPSGHKPGPTADGGFTAKGQTHTQTRVGPAVLGGPGSRKAAAGYGKGSRDRCTDGGAGARSPRPCVCLPCPASRERPSMGMERPRRWGPRWPRHREHPRALRTGIIPDTMRTLRAPGDSPTPAHWEPPQGTERIPFPAHREHPRHCTRNPPGTRSIPNPSCLRASPWHREPPIPLRPVSIPRAQGTFPAPLPRLRSRAPGASRPPLPAADGTYRPEVWRRREVSPDAGAGRTGQSRQRPPPAAAPARLRPAQAERGPAAAAAPGTCPPPPLAAPGAAGGLQPGGRGASTLPRRGGTGGAGGGAGKSAGPVHPLRAARRRILRRRVAAMGRPRPRSVPGRAPAAPAAAAAPPARPGVSAARPRRCLRRRRHRARQGAPRRRRHRSGGPPPGVRCRGRGLGMRGAQRGNGGCRRIWGVHGYMET